MYNGKNNVIYFPLTKCGSTSITHILNKTNFIKLKNIKKYKDKEDKWPVLNNEGLNLGRYKKYYEKIPDVLDSCFKFTIIRDPYERIISSWKYLCPELTFTEFLDKKFYLPKKYNFDELKSIDDNDEIYKIYRNNKHKLHYVLWKINKNVFHTQPYTNDLTNSTGNIKFNYIGLLNDLENELKFIFSLKKISSKNVLNLKKNESKNNLKHTISNEEKQIINKYFEYDIKLYNFIKNLPKKKRLNFNCNVIFNQ